MDKQDILTSERLLRLPEVLQLVPISKSTWWSKVKTGEYPQPIKLGPRVTTWRFSDIQMLIERLSKENQ